MTTTVRLSVLMPVGWNLIDLSGDKEAAIAAAVARAFATADRDSSAAAKHWMRGRLRRAAGLDHGAAGLDHGAAGRVPADRAGIDVVALGYPEAPIGGVLLPVTCAVLELREAPVAADPMAALALLASRDRSARPVPTADSLALRTHEIVDESGPFRSEVANAPLSDNTQSGLIDGVGTLPCLRVRYMLPPVRAERWHVLAFAALLGDAEQELASLYLDLCDAFVSAARWVEAP